ncbi:unnamed protein product, partial [Adineta steineri]
MTMDIEEENLAQQIIRISDVDKEPLDMSFSNYEDETIQEIPLVSLEEAV